MTYVLFFFSLWDMPDLCPKGADLGVKPSAPSCTFPLYGAPKWTYLGSGQPSRRGCLSLSRKFNYQLQSRLPRGFKKYIEVFTGVTLLYDITWRDVMYVLWQTLIPDSRTQVLGEATTFGDEWLEHETGGKREHEIALLPTGSQAVPITEPD